MKPMDLMEALGDLPEEDIAQELAYEVPPKRTAFLVSKPFLTGVSAVACLLVTVGLGLGVWIRQQRPESRPPQETPVVMQTQTHTETTAQTTVVSAAETPTAAKPSRTQTVSGTNQTALAGSTGTAAQTAAIAVQIQTEATASPVPESPSEPAVILQETEPPIQSVQTEPAFTEDTQPPGTSAAVSSAEPPGTSVATTMTLPTEPPRIDYDVLPGFSVTESADGQYLQVTWLSEVPPSPAEVVAYHPESARFVLEFAGMVSGQPDYWYDIYDTGTGKRIRIRMEKRSQFSRELNAGGILTPAFVGGAPGFWYLQEQQCILCWDNGCYECIIYAAPDEQELLMPIAEAMFPDDE